MKDCGTNGRREWRVETEIEIQVPVPNIIGNIRTAQLHWLGHIERMGDNRAVKKAYLRQP